MIHLYIVLYLVVGLIVKWRVEKTFEFEIDFHRAVMVMVCWPLFLGTDIYLEIKWYLKKDNAYTRIRKFFRGF